MSMAVSDAPRINMPRRIDYRHCPTPWKDKFDTKTEANRVVKSMRDRTKRNKNTFGPQTPYACRCGSFHLAEAKRAAVYGKW